MVKKKITIDSLAAMMMRGFTELREELHLELVELKSETKKFRTEMHEEFVETRSRFGYHRSELDDHGSRIKALEKFSGIHTK